MAESIYLEVEENPSCDYMPLQVYEAHRSPVPIFRVNVDEPGRPPGTYEVTGWSSDGGGAPCQAMYAPVSDSGQAVVHLVFGGDWGIRLRPLDSDAKWAVEAPDQWGEPYLMLTNEADIALEQGG